VLSAFSWRNLNLSKIESRPTKTGLGNYFFIIDIEQLPRPVFVGRDSIFDKFRFLHEKADSTLCSAPDWIKDRIAPDKNGSRQLFLYY
jgi:hypothetical protein